MATAPPHVAELRRHLHSRRVLDAKKTVTGLLAQYPDDPWVVADAGFVFAIGGKPEGPRMLERALDLATEPALRAEILYYQALLAQRELGFAQGRKAVVASLEAFSLPVAQRHLLLIDGTKSTLTVDEEIMVRSTCARLAQKSKAAVDDHQTCVGVRVGDTLWAHQMRVTHGRDPFHKFVDHGWHFVDSRVREGLKIGGDFVAGDDLNGPECLDGETLAIDGSYGVGGGVQTAEFVTDGSKEYLMLSCRSTVVDRRDDYSLVVRGPSEFMRVCSLTTGWCTKRLYTHEVREDGTASDATVKIVDGRIVMTPAGGKPETVEWPHVPAASQNPIRIPNDDDLSDLHDENSDRLIVDGEVNFECEYYGENCQDGE